MKVLVIGGTGIITRVVVRQLVERGDTVSAVNRGVSSVELPEVVEQLRGDRTRPEAFRRVFEERTFDAVVDAVCFGPEDARQTLELFGAKAAHIVVLSSIAAYRRPPRRIPICEDSEELWDNPDYVYGYRKARMEQVLFEQSPGGAQITVVRPSLTFGEGARNVGVLRQNAGIVDRIRRGKPLLLFGDGTNPWSFSFAGDIAAAIVSLLGEQRAAGRAFHIASEEPTLWRDLYLEFGRIGGVEPVFAFLPSKTLYSVDPDRFGHIFFEKCYPGLFDCSRLREVLPGYRARIGLRDGLEALIASWDADGLQPDPELDALEDTLVAWAERQPHKPSPFQRPER